MSYDMIAEDVPKFTRRIGDLVLQGSNNTTLIMGTDRAAEGPAKIGDGLGHIKAQGDGKGTGTIHMIAGRSNKDGDPDFGKDKSFLYLSMKTKADTNLGLGSIKEKFDDVASAILKSDTTRIVGRKNIKISVDKGTDFIYITKDDIMIEGKKIKIGKDATILIDGANVVIKGSSIKIGENADHPMPYGDTLKEILSKITGFCQTAATHQHETVVTPMGPGSAPPSIGLSTKIGDIIEAITKIEMMNSTKHKVE